MEEANHHHGGGKSSVRWRICSTVEGALFGRTFIMLMTEM